MNNGLNFFVNTVGNLLMIGSIAAVVLTLAAWLILKFAKVQAAVYRHWVWLYCLIGILAVPMLWQCGPKLKLAVLPERVVKLETVVSTSNQLRLPTLQSLPGKADNPNISRVTRASIENVESKISLKGVLIFSWAIICFVMLVRLGIGWLRFRWMYRRAASDPRTIMSKRTNILVTSEVSSPGCFGILRPCIFLPKAMYDATGEDELRMVLRHEMAHIERRDCLVNFFQRLVEAVFFFHPAVWYASLQVTQEREQICDGYVLDQGTAPSDYAKLLLRFAEAGLERSPFRAVALFEGRLLKRIRSLLSTPLGREPLKLTRRTAIIGACLAAMAFAVVGLLRFEARSARQIAKEEVYGERPHGHSSICGKVLDDATGLPVKNASVYLHYLGTDASVFIHTDIHGDFEFAGIPAGMYSLTTSHVPGYRDTPYNPENKPGQYPPFSLKENRSDIVLRVKPAFAISGYILNEKGKPLAGANQYLGVYAWARESSDKMGADKYRIAQQTCVQSNGSYSLDGLKGEPVYVMVIDYRAGRGEVDFYPPCYYPGTVIRDEAKPITFSTNKVVKNVNFRLRKDDGLILEGRVTDQATGRPVPRACVVISSTALLFDFLTVYTNEEGRYRFQGLGTGEFLVHVDATPAGLVRTRKPVVLNTTAETPPLDFMLKHGLTISGEFVDEQGRPIAVGKSQSFGLVQVTKDNISNGSFSIGGQRFNKYGPATVGESMTSFCRGEGDYAQEDMIFPTESTFMVQGMMAGKTTLVFIPKMEGKGVLKILYKGRDIQTQGLDTLPDQEIKKIQIVIGSAPKEKVAILPPQAPGTAAGPSKELVANGERPHGNSSIRGKVLDEATGLPVKNARVCLLYSGTDTLIFINTDDQGGFAFAGLPEGGYSLTTTHVPGYRDTPYNPENRPGQYPPFSLKKNRSDIVLRVKPAFAISGAVLNEKGKPLVDSKYLCVSAWTKESLDKTGADKYRIAQQTCVQSDGSYFLDGLKGEPVYVMVIDYRAGRGEENYYPPCYYPGTVIRDDAKLITFGTNKVVQNVDIRLRKDAGLVLEGGVTDQATGRPVPRACVVISSTALRFDFLTGYTNDDGRYRFQGLGTGEFLVHVDATPAGLVRTRKPVVLKTTGENPSLDFTLKHGVTIAGQFVDEQGRPIAVGKSQSSGMAQVAKGNISEGSFGFCLRFNKYGPATVGDSMTSFCPGEGDYASKYMIFPTESTFLVQGMMPGKTMLEFTPKMEGKRVLKILYQGQDIRNQSINTVPDQEIKNIQIVIGS
jgi:beta-lactamase regulating signal transducer with metallopeptidase domain